MQQIVIDHRRAQVLVDDEPVELTPREYAIVTTLADGILRPSDEIHFICTGQVNDFGDLTKWHIHNIRQKGIPIITRRGFGYLLAEPAKVIERIPA